jgi:hypothetical protein
LIIAKVCFLQATVIIIAERNYYNHIGKVLWLAGLYNTYNPSIFNLPFQFINYFYKVQRITIVLQPAIIKKKVILIEQFAASRKG